MVGGVLIVLATDRTLSLGALVGFVTLFGITLRPKPNIAVTRGNLPTDQL
jgi:Cu/Ag efflux pump CusA